LRQCGYRKCRHKSEYPGGRVTIRMH
jgi:hypothetical protein